MRDFYAPSQPMPLDQADGLRRLFAGRRRCVLPVVANPHVAFGGVVLDHMAAVLASLGHQVLVVDAGAESPAPHEMALLDLAACIETLTPQVSYLPARGLPLLHVDTRGSAAGFIDAVHQAAPRADVVLLHAEALDLSRLLKGRAARPLLLGADHPESIKHAYASCKVLVQRLGLMSFDLLLAASPQSPRLGAICDSLANCADQFLGAALLHRVHVDPALARASDIGEQPELQQLLQAQLSLDGSALAYPYAMAQYAAVKPHDTHPTNRTAI
jgi:hypothetical protein